MSDTTPRDSYGSTPLLPLLDQIDAASKDYTPGIAYDTRWYEWTLKLAAICRKAFRPPEELAQELELARPEIEAATAALKAERDFLEAVSTVWRHIQQECDIAPGKGFIRLGECTDPALHTHLLEQEGEAWKRYRVHHP